MVECAIRSRSYEPAALSMTIIPAYAEIPCGRIFAPPTTTDLLDHVSTPPRIALLSVVLGCFTA